MNYQDEILRTVPFSLECEQSVIGGLLVSPDRFDVVAGVLSENDFYKTEHRLIYRAIAKLADDRVATDIVTIADAMHTSGTLEMAGGIGYMAEMSANTPSVSNILAYANAVKEYAMLRGLLTACNSIADSVYSSRDSSAANLIDQAQAEIMRLGENVPQDVVGTNQAIKEFIDDLEKLHNNGGEFVGLSTGLLDVDKRTSGLQPSDLIILAARPSMGKTTLAMNFVENAILNGHTALVFSMEMSRKQLFQRLHASIGKIDLEALRTGKLKDDDWTKLSYAASRLKDKKLFVDDRAALTVQQMRSTARKLHKQNNLSLIVIDYLQLASSKAESLNEKTSEISRGLKALAKELNIPVIALSQLNRKVEDRADKRPKNSDLRDSGAIEQDADIVMMLYRDEVYDEDSNAKGCAELIFTKFRNGQTGTDYLASQLHQSRFTNLSHEARPQRATVTPMRRGLK